MIVGYRHHIFNYTHLLYRVGAAYHFKDVWRDLLGAGRAQSAYAQNSRKGYVSDEAIILLPKVINRSDNFFD